MKLEVEIPDAVASKLQAMSNGQMLSAYIAGMATAFANGQMESCADAVLTLGDVTLDCRSWKTAKGGKEIKLADKEFEVLRYLVKRKGATVRREQIQTALWGDRAGSNNVDVYISHLRRKLWGGRKTAIQTIAGVGYRAMEPVAASEQQAAA